MATNAYNDSDVAGSCSFQEVNVTQNEAKQTLPVSPGCASCGKRSYNMKACTRCWCAKYCDKTSQTRDWYQHKSECRPNPTRSLHYKEDNVPQNEAKQSLQIEQDCASCGKRSSNLKTCTRCWCAKYCDKTCQTDHWKQHKSECNKMEDTVTLARQEREKQGPWEAEVSYGGEADLHKHLTGCNKNPGHQKFIPVEEFNVNHLPPGWHDNDLVDLVRATSDRTVLVSVKYISDSRPQTVPGSDKPFPCYKNRSRDMLRTGTGWMKYADIYSNKDDNRYRICKCKECVNTFTPKTQFAFIYIETAAHLVYDHLEAARTTCHLFFDKGGTPADCDRVVTLTGLSFVSCELDKDLSHLRYTSHDLDLARTLKKIKSHFENLSRSMRHKYNAPPPYPTVSHRNYEERVHRYLLGYNNPDNTLTIIVSHPHGCSKQVSVGQCTNVEEKDDVIKYTYTTPTCPGSSGAHLLAMAKFRELIVNQRFVHSGGHGDGSQQLNFCGYGHYIL